MRRDRLIRLRQIARKVIAQFYRSDHDQGSGTIDLATLRITPVRHWNNQWAWWSLRHGALGGQRPAFLIDKAGHYSLVEGERLAVWAQSSDTDAWNDLPVTIGDEDITIQNGDAFPSGKIYISALPMYPFSRVARMVDTWMVDPLVSDTPSSEDGVIANMTARDDGSGRMVPALPVYGFKVSSGAGTKNKAVLTTYNHPSETPGPYQLEGALSWLLGGSDMASFLLDYFDFYVYPCVNPQGVWAGYFRSCPEDPTADHNRQWAAGGLECVDAVKTAMAADTGGTIEVGLDYHSWMNASDIFADIQTGDASNAIYAAFLAEMQTLDSDFDLAEQDIQASLRYLWRNGYSAKLAAVMEQGGELARGVPEWKTYGAHSLQAVARMLAAGRWTNGPSVGSRSFNGSTNRLDWTSPFNPSGHALTISAWIYSAVNGSNNYIACFHDAGDTGIGCVFNITNGDLDFVRHGTTDYLWYKSTGADIPTGQWVHVLVTSNGGLASDSVALYQGGASVLTGHSSGTGSETAHTGKLSLGGRIYSDTRNFNGRIAQVAIWDRVLGASEISALAAGYAPALVAANGLVFGPPFNTDSLLDPISGVTGVADGTTFITGVGNGPAIIY